MKRAQPKNAVKRSSTLVPTDISEYPERCPEFDMLFDYIRGLDCPIYDRKDISYGLAVMIDMVYWRSTETYLFMGRNIKGELAQHDVYHPAIHRLLVEKYDGAMEGKPLFTLLAEVISTAAEFYFTLKNIAQRGVGPSENLILEQYVRGQLAIEPNQKKAEKYVLKAVNTSLSDPFSAFLSCVLNGFRLYEELFAYEQKRSNGQAFRISDLVNFANGRIEFDFVLCSYNVGANVPFALTHAGRVSTPKDKACVKLCMQDLRNSTSFKSWLELLGARVSKIAKAA